MAPLEPSLANSGNLIHIFAEILVLRENYSIFCSLLQFWGHKLDDLIMNSHKIVEVFQ